MKTKFIILITLLVCIGISSSFAQSKKEYVEVLYFHRTQRCNTCQAIEKTIKELLEKDYKKDIKTGALVFTSIDFQQDSTNTLVGKNEIEDPTLLIVYHKKGKETVSNYTDEGFQYALSNPAKLKEILSEKINECFR